MIEKIIRDYLLSKLTEDVFVQLPKNPPDSYVAIERTGGRTENHIRYATFAIQSIAPKMLAAIQLHEQVIEEMLNIIELDSIGSISLNSNYNFTDGDTGTYRYQAVFDIVYY